MPLARTDSAGVLDYLFGQLSKHEGGWLITANLDFLRRHARDVEARALYAEADLRVADGMPLVWAAKLQGDHLPERVAGSALTWLIMERAALEGRSIYFLGGEPSANKKAVEVVRARWPALKVSGNSSPMISSPPSASDVASLREEIGRDPPDILLVGMGSPKQEQLIRELRPYFARTWMVGVGISFSFVAGEVSRAPVWMQRGGLEWLWRFGQEPRRLARRYFIDDIPFAFELFGRAIWRRFQGRR